MAETSEVKNSSREPFMRKYGPQCFFAAFAFLIFWKYFLLDQTFYAGDMAFALLPLADYAVERLASGHLPLWNPHLLAGTPGLAEATHQTLYPPHLLLLLLGPARGMSWLMPLHLFWMALGVYLFLRTSLGIGRIAATFGALSAAFGGIMLGGLSIPYYIGVSSWIPWALLGYERARSGGWAGWVGVCIAMQLLPGGVSYAYYTLVLLLAYHLYRSFETWPQSNVAPTEVSPTEVTSTEVAPPRKVSAIKLLLGGANLRGWCTLALALAVSVGLSAAQLVPQAELAQLSERGTRATYEYVIYGSLVPHHFPVTLLFPGFYGLFDSPTREGFLPTAQLAYMGVPALIALVIAVFSSQRRRAVWFWLAVGVLSFFFALGRHNPIYHWLYEWVPGFALFRWPTRWLILTTFSGAMLSSMGLEVLAQLPQRERKIKLTALAVGILIGIAGVLFILLSGAPPEATITAWPQIVLVALTVALIALLPASRQARPTENDSKTEAAVNLRHQAGQARWVLVGFVGLLALDLWWLSQSMELQHTLSVAALENKPASVALLKSQKPQERFWATAQAMPLEGWQVGDVTTPALDFRARNAAATREMMPSCMASEQGTLGLTGAWGALMPTKRNARPLYQPATPPVVQQRWLRLLNARYYLDLRPIPDQGLHGPALQVVAESPYIYRDEKALSRAFWVPQAQQMEPEKIVTAISEGSIQGAAFDPRRTVLLEKPATASTSAASVDSATDAPFAGALPTVEMQEPQPEEIRLKVDAPRDGYIVLMDTPYPGWRVSVDKTATEWQPANWVGRAIRLSTGEHEVVYRYDPQSVRLGLFISLLTLMGLATSLTMRPRSRR